MKQKSYVVIADAPKMDYMMDYVTLPKSYGTDAYFEREDIKAIRSTVHSALEELNKRCNFTELLKNNRHTLIKPNLVSVYHNSGFDEKDYPETTDPRVFEAVVSYIRQYTNNISIVESSGKPMPTPVSFSTAGYDRIAKYYGTKLVPLEQQPVVRYMLPKAEVMKEVYLPKILDEVVRGEAFYISVPKMKTNLYTGVTLGFKNAMGTIPYFLRERNHSYRINKKLADLLYLFKPDLTVIDGIIGGEGNTPAPVDPVRIGMIVCGNNSVEVDRITTHMMGFDPEKNKLMQEAVRRGFNDPDAETIGQVRVTKFRPAISSLMDEKTSREFPNLLALAGRTNNNAPKVTDITKVTPEIAFEIEQACSGGCLAATKSGLDYYNFKAKAKRDFHLCIIEGSGIVVDNKRWWFDRNGKSYSEEDIAALPMRKMAMGNCAKTAKHLVKYYAGGCCDPAKCMAVVCKAAGVRMPIMSLKNKGLLKLVIGIIKTVHVRRKLIKNGFWVDCPHIQEDRIFELPELTELDREKDYIEWPLPVMNEQEKKQQMKDQYKILLSNLA